MTDSVILIEGSQGLTIVVVNETIIFRGEDLMAMRYYNTAARTLEICGNSYTAKMLKTDKNIDDIKCFSDL